MKFSPWVPLLVFGLASCAVHPRVAHQFFDERSSNTVMVVDSPLVFARDRSDVAAHARDFATLVTVEIDESGDYHQYLLLYEWSTVDRRMVPQSGNSAGVLRIIADGRMLDLHPMDKLPLGLDNRRELHVPNHGAVTAYAYNIDVRTLDFIATSRAIRVTFPRQELNIPYPLFEDGRASLSEFVKHAAAP